VSIPVIDADELPKRSQPGDPRAYGYGLLVLALVAALCVPGLLGRRANGAAVAAPPAPPPTVGECLAPIEKPADLDRLTGVPAVDCSTPHSAEVVFVGQFGATDGYPENTAASSLVYPYRACALQADQFVGISAAATAQVNPNTGAVAHVRPQVDAPVMVPTRHQWRSGQRWYACQVRPAGDTLPMSYDGSVLQAAWAATLPAPFARCAQVIGGDAVPCTEPHYAEQLTDFFDARTRVDCHGVAARLIGTHDPSFHGSLSLTGWQASGGRTACWATSTTGEPFIGTLLGLGDQPFPGA
jgi:hypothetical protein